MTRPPFYVSRWADSPYDDCWVDDAGNAICDEPDDDEGDDDDGD